MCEFEVFLDGKKVFDDAVIAEAKEGKVALRNILGERIELENRVIAKVNVPYEKLFLVSILFGRSSR